MTPAEKVIEKCGGIAKTAILTRRTESVVYRWTYEKSKGGTGGAIPRKAQLMILKAAAERGGPDVRPEDFFVTSYQAVGDAA